MTSTDKQKHFQGLFFVNQKSFILTIFNKISFNNQCAIRASPFPSKTDMGLSQTSPQRISTVPTELRLRQVTRWLSWTWEEALKCSLRGKQNHFRRQSYGATLFIRWAKRQIKMRMLMVFIQSAAVHRSRHQYFFCRKAKKRDWSRHAVRFRIKPQQSWLF